MKLRAPQLAQGEIMNNSNQRMNNQRMYNQRMNNQKIGNQRMYSQPPDDPDKSRINNKERLLIIIALIIGCIVVGLCVVVLWPNKKGTISGFVADEATGDPVTGVTVIATDSKGKSYTHRDNTDTTGRDGYFKLELPEGSYTLEFDGDSQGYEHYETSKKYKVKWPPVVVEPEVEPEKELFTIDPNTIENYSANLDPYEYYRYNSDYDEFSFGYPAHLFNRVESNYDRTSSYLGTNIETHTFYGSKGSELSYSLARRDDNLNLTKKINNLIAKAGEEITDSKNEIQNEAFEDKGFARCVVTGFDRKGNVIYTLIKVNSSYVMRMRIKCPPYKDEDDKIIKWYVQECMYRWCGFSNKDQGMPRSYKDFKEEYNKKYK